jgi:competence protein ComEC
LPPLLCGFLLARIGEPSRESFAFGRRMRVPAALLALPLLIGAATGLLFHTLIPEHLTLASAGAAALCTVAGFGFLAERLRPAVVACTVAATVLGGFAMASATIRDLLRPPLLDWFDRLPGDEGGPFIVHGILREDAAAMPYGVQLTLDVTRVGTPGSDADPARGGARLVVGGEVPPGRALAWRAGRAIRAPASVRRPMTFANPGVSDDAQAQALRGIALAGSVKSAALVDVLAHGGPVAERSAAVRAWVRRVITAHVAPLDERSAAVAIAILIGDRTGLSDEDERRLQDAGTYHVIAISGGNIAILAVFLVGITRALRIPYRLAAGLSIVFLLFYGEIAAGSASVERAVTAACVFLVALLLDHRGAALNVVAVAAVLAMAVRPVTPADGGFLLSFGATLGILLGASRLAARLPAAGSTGGRLRTSVTRLAAGILIATVCAEIALAPVAATLFSRVTVAGLVLNFAAIPLMTLVQCGSMALLAAHAVSPGIAGWCATVVQWSAWALVESARLVDVFPWLARDVVPPPLWTSALYYALCVTALFLDRLRRVALIAWAIVAFGIWVGVSGLAGGQAAAPTTLRVVMLDVGQGDATLAILPGGTALLVDAGGIAGTTYDVGGRVVLPALRALGVRRLHALVLTHGDPDHVGGAAVLLERMPIANVWEGVPVPPDPARRSLIAAAASRRIVWRTVRPGDVEVVGGVEIRILHPPEPDWERQRVRNDDSVVLELRYGDVSILLPGDIGGEGERAVAGRLALGRTVVLKAAHHGSATSSGEAFLDAARPDVVVVSAGRNNRFGHPAPVVVDRLRRRDVPIFNTATDGAVLIDTDGRGVQIRGWLSARELVIPARDGEDQ